MHDVDVLIVGAGPAGLVLAAQLAAFPEIRTAVVERREGPLRLGQADGVACRTVEMFEAFGPVCDQRVGIVEERVAGLIAVEIELHCSFLSRDVGFIAVDGAEQEPIMLGP